MQKKIGATEQTTLWMLTQRSHNDEFETWWRVGIWVDIIIFFLFKLWITTFTFVDGGILAHFCFTVIYCWIIHPLTETIAWRKALHCILCVGLWQCKGQMCPADLSSDVVQMWCMGTSRHSLDSSGLVRCRVSVRSTLNKVFITTRYRMLSFPTGDGCKVILLPFLLPCSLFDPPKEISCIRKTFLGTWRLWNESMGQEVSRSVLFSPCVWVCVVTLHTW